MEKTVKIDNISINKNNYIGDIRQAGVPNVGNVAVPIITVSTDYNDLKNKPEINEITLEGNKNLEDLNVNRLSNIDIENIINSII